VKVYIDESGDLGFRQKGSSFFVIAALIIYDPLSIHRCFAKVRKNRLKKKYREMPEFKYNNSSHEIKRRILSCIARSDVDITYSVLRKEQLDHHLRDKYQRVYNYLTASLVAKSVRTLRLIGDVNIVVDKSLNRIQQDAFDDYMITKMFERNNDEDLIKTPITIDHINSQDDPCIQAADFIAGALHYYYRTGNDEFFCIFEERIKLAYDYFKGSQK